MVEKILIFSLHVDTLNGIFTVFPPWWVIINPSGVQSIRGDAANQADDDGSSILPGNTN